MNPMIIGAMLNSALYLVMVVYFAMWKGNHLSAELAIAALGVTYLSYLAQIPGAEWPRVVSALLVVASILLGAAAGLALLV